MAKILIMSLVFPPDQVSTAQIMGDIAVDLREQGHQVTVITTIPHYNPDGGDDSLTSVKLWGPLLKQSSFNGIEVFHTAMLRKGKGILSRLLSYLLFHSLSLLAGLILIEKPDVILAPSPPLTVALIEWLLAVRYRVPFVYIAQEVFPDILIDMGVIRGRLLISFLLNVESFIYQRAGALVVITEQMRQRLIKKGVPSSKVTTIPNFVDTDELRPASKRNEFSIQHRIDDVFVVSYAGNLGPVQSLDEFIKAAEILKSNPGIQFLILGEGILKDDLKSQVAELGLGNVLILPYQPYSLMQQVYAASNLCLVPQSAETGPTSMPSKVYRIMACARPVLAYADPDSELAGLINEVGCGFVVPVGDWVALAKTIQEASGDPDSLVKMSQIGRKHVERFYARKVVTDRYGMLVADLVADKTE